MLYRQKRRKKVVKTTEFENSLSYMEKHSADDMIDEVIFNEKKYQDMPLDELCRMIDLISPTSDNYPYIVDFRTDFIILHRRQWKDSVSRRMLFTKLWNITENLFMDQIMKV